MQLKGRALVVDDQGVWLELFTELLHELGLEVETATTYEQAIGLVDSRYFHLAVVDVRLKDEDAQNTQGMDVLSLHQPNRPGRRYSQDRDHGLWYTRVGQRIVQKTRRS